jgi:hypothetical protein
VIVSASILLYAIIWTNYNLGAGAMTLELFSLEEHMAEGNSSN